MFLVLPSPEPFLNCRGSVWTTPPPLVTGPPMGSLRHCATLLSTTSSVILGLPALQGPRGQLWTGASKPQLGDSDPACSRRGLGLTDRPGTMRRRDGLCTPPLPSGLVRGAGLEPIPEAVRVTSEGQDHPRTGCTRSPRREASPEGPAWELLSPGRAWPGVGDA